MRLRLFLAALVALAGSGAARGDGFSIFLPRPVTNGAYLDVFGIAENYDLQTPAQRTYWSDEFLKEKVTLFSNGYFYHPRAVTYSLSVSGALKQENYDATFIPAAVHRSGEAFEYDAKLFFLPEHPYNLELFALRFEPLFREENTPSHDTVSSSRGLDFRYRARPWFAHLHFSDDTIESTESWSDVRKLMVDGRYAREFGAEKKLSVDAVFSPARLSGSDGFHGDSTDASVTALAEYGRFHLDSSLSSTTLTQQGGGTAVETNSRQLSLFERLGADLPYRLRGDLYFRYQDGHADYGDGASPGSSSFGSIRRDLELDLRHQLFESLQTLYTFRDDWGSSAGGSSSTVGNNLTFLYTKRIPDGQLLASLYGGRSESESAGQTQAADERHTAVRVPGTFALTQPLAVPESVELFVVSPAPPYELVRLTENVHYTVATVGDKVEITVLTLPVEFIVPGTFDFRVSYSLAGGDYRLRTDSFGNSASLELLNRHLTPYYSYSLVRSDVLSGSAPGGGLDSQTFTTGLSVQFGWLRASGEYQDVHWDASPYRGWKFDLQCSGPLTRTTTGYLTALYQDRRFEEITEENARPAYTEKAYSAAGSVQQFLMSRKLSLSVGGSYSRTEGLAWSESYTVNGSLSWRVGKMDLSGGGNYTGTQTRDLSAYDTSRIRRYFFLRLRRTLF